MLALLPEALAIQIKLFHICSKSKKMLYKWYKNGPFSGVNTTQVATPLKRLSIRVQKSFSYSHTSYFKDRYCHTPQSCPHMKTKSHTLYSCCQTQTRALKAAVNQRKREPRPLKLLLMHRAHHASQLLSDAEDHTLPIKFRYWHTPPPATHISITSL